MQVYSLCYPVKTTNGSKDGSIRHVLLGRIKQKGWGQGTWNGFGGKQEPDEDILDTTIRELREESGLKAVIEDVSFKGSIRFNFKDPRKDIILHIFLLYKWEDIPIETKEMYPTWFNINELPLNNLTDPLDIYWFEEIFTEKIVLKHFYFNEKDEFIKVCDDTEKLIF